MKYPALGAALALAACQPGPAGVPATVGGTPAASASAIADKPDAATALLGELLTPRQKGRYAPRDECAGLPGATAFRRKLADAVRDGDAEALAALASPDVKLGFGGDDGRARFLAQLRQPDGQLMAEIGRLLRLGCAVSAEGSLTAPWYFAQDLGDIDGYAATIVTGEDVPLHEQADAKSAVKQRISWDLVELNDGLYPERAFQLVTAGDGAKGYVATTQLRSLLDYRLLADREGGEWRITAILAGD